MRYAKPLDAGLASEPRAAGRRVARLLHALEDHVTVYIFQTGEARRIARDVQRLKLDIIHLMKAEGWRIYRSPSDRWQVLPPKGR